ncbi:MAG: hypothetical protein M3Q69_21195 [Acidobacteriota bacterium]|nr:hypothetical protein [Acidobacteriota bacterium]
MRCIAYLLFAALVVRPAAAMRFAFSAVDSEQRPIEGAEVCVTGAEPAGIGHWLGSDDVRCYPATTVIAFPPGYWAVYGVKRGAYVTTHPYFIPVRGDPNNTDSGFKSIQLDLTPAVSIALPSAPRVVLYFPGTASRMSFSLPLQPGESRATVPQGADFIALAMSERRIVRVARGIWTNDGTANVAWSTGARPAVIGAIRFPRLPSDVTREFPQPEITLKTEEGRIASVLRHGRVRDANLFLFDNVPQTRDAAIEVSGPTYEPAQIGVDLSTKGSDVVIAPPVQVTPAAELTVSLSADAADFLRGLTDRCESADITAAPQWQLVLDGCSGAPGCRRIERRDLTLTAGPQELKLPSIPLGDYELRIEMSCKRVVWRSPWTAPAGAVSLTVLPALSRIVGTVRRAGIPVRARIAIGNGAAMSTADGMWSVVSAADRTRGRIDVTTCDHDADTYTFFPGTPLTHMATIEIDLPSPVDLTVVEANSRTPIADAKISITVADPDSRAVLLNAPGPRTDIDGHARLRNPPAGRPYVICAKADAHDEACGTPENGSLTLALPKIVDERGTIEGVAGVERGMLFFVNASGDTLEAVTVARDGTFRFRQPHAGQHAIFISASHPLALIAVPMVDPATLRLPAGRIRSVTIRSAPAEDVEIGLALGDVIVPSAALSRHQAFRGLSTVTKPANCCCATSSTRGMPSFIEATRVRTVRRRFRLT